MNQTEPAPAPWPEHTAPTLAHRQAQAILAAWSQGEPPDACAALARYPGLREHKSVVLDLAHEEYLCRHRAGQAPDLPQFVARFPGCQSTLRAMIATGSFLEPFMDRLDAVPVAGPPDWPRVGESLGDFTLRRELGRGAFARVFLATEASTGDRPVALKVSREGGEEARTLGRLPHPNIVPVLSSRVDPATQFVLVCMPFLGGATLTDVLDHAYPRSESQPPRGVAVLLEAVRATIRPEDPPPSPVGPSDPLLGRGRYADGVIHLGAQLAEVLAFLHDNGVYHRDLKPSNVLLSAAGRPLLLDFNLSLDAHLAAPRLGGTLPYMAPEYIRAGLGRPSGTLALDGRADLFALGVILYELLTGRHPFGPVPLELANDRLGPLLLERQQAGFPPLRDRNPQVDGPTARLVEQCLAVEPANRPARASELAAGLRRHFRPSRRLRRWAARRPRRTASLVGLVLALVAGLAWGWSQVPPYPERQYRRGVTAFQAGDYAAAVDGFSRAIEADPRHPRAYFERGRALLALGERETDRDQIKALFSSAQSSLAIASKQHASNMRLACWAYACAQAGEHDAAILIWDEALVAGFSPRAVLLNNWAFSHIQKRQFARANELLGQALAEDPTLRAAYYNRALVAIETRPLPATALADIRRATTLGPMTAQLHLDAARVFTAVAREDRRRKRLTDGNAHSAAALRHLRLAVENGYDPTRIMASRFFNTMLGQQTEFKQLGQQPRSPLSASLANLRLLNPALFSLPE